MQATQKPILPDRASIKKRFPISYQRGTNVVGMEPDVAKFFFNAETVNDSLRALAGIIRRQKAVAK